MDKKTYKILFQPKEGTSGFWGLRNVPISPVETSISPLTEFNKEMAIYREALESCKSNSLEIVNPETIFNGTHIDSEIERWYKPGDIFDVPEGYKLEKGGYCEGCRRAGLYHCAHADTCGYAKDVLRLVKTETFKERFTKLFPQPETKDFEWKDDMKLFDKKIDVAHIGHRQPEPEESQVGEKIDMVLYSRIMDSVHKSLEWEDGEITGIQIDNLEQKIKGILQGVTIQRKKQ